MPIRRLACRRPMLARVAALVFAVAAPLAAAGEPPALDSQEAVLAHLDRTRQLFLAAIEGLTLEQWAWKPSEDRWSVAECAEHITRTEPFLRSLVAGAIANPMPAEGLAKSHGKSERALAMIVDRSQKFQAPEPINPEKQGEVRSHARIVRDFNFERGRTFELAASQSDLTAYAAVHPGFEELDLAGWLYFLSGHVERHTLQIEEVRATPGFPGS